MQEEEADLGVLLDTDCDRATLVDHAGKVLSGNRLIALIAAILLDKDPGATIVTDSVTSSGLSRFISEWGGVHYRFRRGSRNVIEEAKRLNDEGIDCPLAIETSGHTAFRDNKFLDDGLYMATWLICEAYDLKRCGKTLSGLIDDLAEPVESTEIRLRIQDEEPLPVARSVIETVLSHTWTTPPGGWPPTAGRAFGFCSIWKTGWRTPFSSCACPFTKRPPWCSTPKATCPAAYRKFFPNCTRCSPMRRKSTLRP